MSGIIDNEDMRSVYGLACPKCGHADHLWITVTTQVDHYGNGVDDYGDCEWDDDSHCQCPDCRHEGTAKDFRVEEDESQ
jgi:hypothetical protein